MRRSLDGELSSPCAVTTELPSGDDIDPEGILARRLRLFEVTASGLRGGAVQAEVADVLTAKVLEGVWTEEDTAPLIEWAAEAGGSELDDARVGVFLDATNNPRLLALPPRMAVEVQLRLLAALTPVTDASLWTGGVASSVSCISSVGSSSPTRRARGVARQTLEAEGESRSDRGVIHGIPVQRWQRPFAALVVRTRLEHRPRALAFARETAALLAPILEREMLLERNERREHMLVDAAEKRLARMGFDLHDGPLQDVGALAADVRLAQTQLRSNPGVAVGRLFDGRLQDFEARIVEIDRSLRELALSLEAKSVLEQPLPDVLRREIESFEHRAPIAAEIEFSGDFAELTATQRLTLFRALQEALTNVREHSGATIVRVSCVARRDCIELKVADNGNGFEVTGVLIDAARRGRLGLVGISERVRMLGGAFDVKSRPGGSTELVVRLPAWRPLHVPSAAACASVG